MSDKNPNRCDLCDHKKYPDGGWCYVFKHEPTTPCFNNTAGATLGVVLKHPHHAPAKGGKS